MKLVFLHGFTGSPGSLRWVTEALRGARGDEGRHRVGANPLPLENHRGADAAILEQVSGSGRVQVLAPPLVGHHGGPSAACRFEEEVERIVRLIDEAKLGQVHLLGYSLGGRLALGVALRAPELLCGLSLIGVSPGLDDPRARAERREADEGWCRLLAERGLGAFIEAWSALPLWDTQRGLVAERLTHQRRERERHTAEGLVTSLRSVGLGQMPGYSSALEKLRLPVSLMVGALDSKYVALAERMQRALPRASLHVVPRAGHNLLIEAPEQVAAVLGRQTVYRCRPQISN
ncbi:MAG: alpha/beta fold hydrolase [Polyangiaceae bacterium]|nr:alpha/beta fold hydrolase [Polyangiaceae bacterium]MCW5790369.1 alpha/beta fold hydrolase [Polyangiaceae bacterium]